MMHVYAIKVLHIAYMYKETNLPPQSLLLHVNATNKTMQSSDRVKTFIFHNLRIEEDGEYPEKEKTLFYNTLILALFI